MITLPRVGAIRIGIAKKPPYSFSPRIIRSPTMYTSTGGMYEVTVMTTQQFNGSDLPQEKVAQPKGDQKQGGHVRDGEVGHEDVVGGDRASCSVSQNQFSENSNRRRTSNQRRESAERSPDYNTCYHVTTVSNYTLIRPGMISDP